jgi:hypothetical protein
MSVPTVSVPRPLPLQSKAPSATMWKRMRQVNAVRGKHEISAHNKAHLDWKAVLAKDKLNVDENLATHVFHVGDV